MSREWGIGEAGRTPACTPLDDYEAAELQKCGRPDYPQGRRLSCGHMVYYADEVMSASMGTSCLDCYDRMSD